MRRINPIQLGLYLSLLLVLGALPVGRAQPPEDTSNAATWYRRAIERLNGITAEQWDVLAEYQGGTPSPEVRGVLQRAQPALADLQRAANQSYSDFGLDFNDGVFMLIPHLGGMRQLTRLAAADARVRIADGDGSGAAAEIAAMCRMADHVSSDHVMISSLVSAAVFSLTGGVMDGGYDGAVFSTADSALLLTTMQSFDQRDPFSAIDAMVGEQMMSMQTIRNALAAGDPMGFREIASVYGLDGEQQDHISAMDGAALERELGNYSRVMDRYIVAFSMEDPEAAKIEIARLDAACQNGEFGVMAAVLAPALGTCYEALDKHRSLFHERMASLERIVGGEVSISDLANAAVWYRRGMKKMEALDETWTQAVVQVDPGQPLDDLTIKALEDGAADAVAAVAEFIDGSKIRRSDFSRQRNVREVFVPLYADGMRDAFRLLSLEALRQEAAGDHAAAMRLVTAALRMSAHLSDDGLIVSSLVARDGFLLAARAGQALSQRGTMDVAALPELSAAIRRNGAGDAFGFIAACSDARKAIGARLLDWTQGEERELLGARYEAWLAQVDADGLLYLLAMQDLMEYSLQPREPFNRRGAGRLGEFLLGETIELAQIDALVFTEHLKKKQPESFELPATIHLVGASEKAASARQDLWDAMRWERELQIESRPDPEPQP